MKRIIRKEVSELICDTTYQKLEECVMDDKPGLGVTLEFNTAYEALFDGIYPNTFHFSNEVAKEIAQFLSTKYPDSLFNKTIQDENIF